jgi:hypothetical protein
MKQFFRHETFFAKMVSPNLHGKSVIQGRLFFPDLSGVSEQIET